MQARAKPSRLAEEAKHWSAPTTLSAAELAATEPSPEFMRRFKAHAAGVAAKAAAEAAYVKRFSVHPITGRPTNPLRR